MIRKYFGDIEIRDIENFMDYYAKAMWYEERNITNTAIAIGKAFETDD